MQIPFKKKSTNNLGQLGVGFHPNGISFAHVISKKNERPILTFCDFQPAHNLEEQENILNTVTKEYDQSITAQLFSGTKKTGVDIAQERINEIFTFEG